MELSLNRIDYVHVGTTTNDCLKVIHTGFDDNSKRRLSTVPLESTTNNGEQLTTKISRKGSKKKTIKTTENETDKLIIGDQNGVLLCMERKDGNTNILYKTPPGPPIRRLMMGGALGSIQDKAFIACGTEVRGFSRKGKQFLAFNSNLTESIQSLFIYGVDMLIASRNSHYHFHDCVEKSHFSCNDYILDILCLPITEGGWVGRGITPVLACADKTIKVLDGSRIVYQIPLNEVPTVLHLFCNDGGYNKQKILFGCRNGHIGLIDLGVDFWTMCQEFETKSFGTITAIDCYPMMGGNNTHQDIGKEDGLIELYSIDDNDNLTFRQLYQCEESITGLQGGRVNNSMYPELLVTTYTGWVFGLTTEPIFSVTSALDDKGEEMPEMEIKVQQMRIEIEQLENKVRDERERFNTEMTRLNQITNEKSLDGLGNTNLIAFTLGKNLNIKKFNFFKLTIPIDYVLLQSDVKVDLLDVERNSAVISITEPENGSGNALLAVYRCQADITRMEMRIRSIEGQFGTLRLYIVPRLVPLTCKVRSYSIKPLALHERVHYFDEHRPMNTLTLTGSFSIAEAHSWLSLCIGEVPERCPQAETVTFNFRSTFNGGTQLQANYSKGRVCYRSDNLSTIVILRDVISRIVSMGQIKVHIACDINDESIKKCLELIWPKLEYQSKLIRKLELAKVSFSSKMNIFVNIFFSLIILSTIYSQNIPLIDPISEQRKLPKPLDSILNDWKRTPSLNWWHFVLVFIFPIIALILICLLLFVCIRWYKWFRAKRDAFLQALEAKRIKRSRSRSRSRSISRKSSAKSEEEDKFKKEEKSVEISKSRPELSIDIEAKTKGQQVLSGVHLTESKSEREHSLSLDLEFRPKGEEKSIKSKIPIQVGSLRDCSLSASGSLGSPSIVGDLPAVGSLRNEPPNSLRKNEGSKKKEIVELEDNFEDISYLNSELTELLSNYDNLHKEVDNQQIHLDRILGIITDLFIDKYKMLGQNVKYRAKELLDILKDECKLEQIIDFFNGK
ncbi:hypothetical protein Mgra_00008176 [Meloidogyne graminicola]|uniref:Bardet-Biedl syndrome 7 protein n=1 Tax=Meloidogyne graminicola TaxID=189291 RepID=A0A8S9ZGE2_9BILA|nr:hypothetical protein Mgra_00008176 [Meloidogyne graminicola]